MKIKTVGILLVLTFAGILYTGCGSASSATQAAEEREETEREGTGEDIETETEIKEAGERADSLQELSETVSENTASVRASVAVCLQDDKNTEDQKDGEWLKEGFAGINCETFLAFADNNADQQVQQIREMMEKEPQILVINPVDPYNLTEVLAEAEERGITVFSYDDLIMQTGALSYYVTFDMREIGHRIARRMIEKKDLKKKQSDGEQVTVEFFMGSGESLHTLFLFNGILEELEPYLEDGTLICPSGQMSFTEVVSDVSQDGTVKNRFSRILSDYYPNGDCPDMLFTGFDKAVVEILEELDTVGIVPGTEAFPLINGAGCEAEVIRAIAEGRVSFDVYLDRKDLVDLCVTMADTVISGETPEVNNYGQYDNGTKLIHTNTVSGELMDSNNYEILIDIGALTEDEVTPVYEAMPQESVFPFFSNQEKNEDPAEQESSEEISNSSVEEMKRNRSPEKGIAQNQ